MILTVLVFFLILSVLVLVHEFGHFVAAKKMGIKVEEFGFGLPPRLYGKKIGETVYSVNWLPIGGFVKLFGEEGEEDIKKNSKFEIRNSKLRKELRERAFYTRPVWQRVIVLLAGVTMNFILAVFIISFLFTQGVMVPTPRVHIQGITADSPAQKAGLKVNDIIKKIKYQKSDAQRHLEGGPDVTSGDSFQMEESEIKTGDQLTGITKQHLGEEIILVIARSGVEEEIKIVPRKEYPKDQGPMGIVISNYEEKKYSITQAPILGLKESFGLSFELAKGIGTTLWKLVTFQNVSRDVAGPFGIAQMTGEAVKSGESSVLELLGLLSLNLAIVNALPFPALDGGRLLFVIIEGVTGKKIKTDWERYVHQIGMIILLSLMVLVTINDLVRIFSK